MDPSPMDRDSIGSHRTCCRADRDLPSNQSAMVNLASTRVVHCWDGVGERRAVGAGGLVPACVARRRPANTQSVVSRFGGDESPFRKAAAAASRGRPPQTTPGWSTLARDTFADTLTPDGRRSPAVLRGRDLRAAELRRSTPAGRERRPPQLESRNDQARHPVNGLRQPRGACLR